MSSSQLFDEPISLSEIANRLETPIAEEGVTAGEFLYRAELCNQTKRVLLDTTSSTEVQLELFDALICVIEETQAWQRTVAGVAEAQISGCPVLQQTAFGALSKLDIVDLVTRRGRNHHTVQSLWKVLLGFEPDHPVFRTNDLAALRIICLLSVVAPEAAQAVLGDSAWELLPKVRSDDSLRVKKVVTIIEAAVFGAVPQAFPADGQTATFVGSIPDTFKIAGPEESLVVPVGRVMKAVSVTQRNDPEDTNGSFQLPLSLGDSPIENPLDLHILSLWLGAHPLVNTTPCQSLLADDEPASVSLMNDTGSAPVPYVDAMLTGTENGLSAYLSVKFDRQKTMIRRGSVDTELCGEITSLYREKDRFTTLYTDRIDGLVQLVESAPPEAAQAAAKVLAIFADEIPEILSDETLVRLGQTALDRANETVVAIIGILTRIGVYDTDRPTAEIVESLATVAGTGEQDAAVVALEGLTPAPGCSLESADVPEAALRTVVDTQNRPAPVRARAIETLVVLYDSGGVSTETVITKFREAIASESPEVRRNAVSGLYQVAIRDLEALSEQDIMDLLLLITEQHERVSEMAIDVLGDLGRVAPEKVPREAVTKLEEVVHSPKPALMLSAVSALAALSDSSIPEISDAAAETLTRIITEAEEQTAATAADRVGALLATSPELLSESLISALSDALAKQPPAVGESAAGALLSVGSAEIPEPVVERLGLVVAERPPIVAAAAACALGVLARDERTLPHNAIENLHAALDREDGDQDIGVGRQPVTDGAYLSYIDGPLRGTAPTITQAVTWAFSKIGATQPNRLDHQIIDDLRRRLLDADRQTATVAVWAIGCIGQEEPQLLPARLPTELVAMIQDRQVPIEHEALITFGRIGSEAPRLVAGEPMESLGIALASNDATAKAGDVFCSILNESPAPLSLVRIDTLETIFRQSAYAADVICAMQSAIDGAAPADRATLITACFNRLQQQKRATRAYRVAIEFATAAMTPEVARLLQREHSHVLVDTYQELSGALSANNLRTDMRAVVMDLLLVFPRAVVWFSRS